MKSDQFSSLDTLAKVHNEALDLTSGSSTHPLSLSSALQSKSVSPATGDSLLLLDSPAPKRDPDSQKGSHFISFLFAVMHDLLFYL